MIITNDNRQAIADACGMGAFIKGREVSTSHRAILNNQDNRRLMDEQLWLLGARRYDDSADAPAVVIMEMGMCNRAQLIKSLSALIANEGYIPSCTYEFLLQAEVHVCTDVHLSTNIFGSIPMGDRCLHISREYLEGLKTECHRDATITTGCGTNMHSLTLKVKTLYCRLRIGYFMNWRELVTLSNRATQARATPL